jgi:GTP-binding protein EngB required for normal cell division
MLFNSKYKEMNFLKSTDSSKKENKELSNRIYNDLLSVSKELTSLVSGKKTDDDKGETDYELMYRNFECDIKDFIDNFILSDVNKILNIMETKEIYNAFLLSTAPTVYNLILKSSSFNDFIKSEKQKKQTETEEFVRLFNESKKWSDILNKFGDKSLKIIVFGKTQVGKTATVKNLFSIRDIRLKGGTKSDTRKIREYDITINNVTLTYIDTPGFLDSEGNDENNFELIKNYLIKNKVHIVLWFAKLADIVNSKEQEMIKYLTDSFTHHLWDHAMVVLTNANDDPPEEYITDIYQEKVRHSYQQIGSNANDNERAEQLLDDGFGIEENDIEFDTLDDFYGKDNEEQKIKINEEDKHQAWRTYVNRKKIMWQDAFVKHGSMKNRIQITLVENNRYHRNNRRSENGDRMLIDGTPIWETLMTNMMNLVSLDMTPFAFLVLIGNTKNIKLKKKKNVNNKVKIVTKTQQQQVKTLEDVTTTVATTPEEQAILNGGENKVELERENSTSSLWSVDEQDTSDIKLTNKQKIIIKAAHNVKTKKKVGWCNLF